ncbi:MAG: PKD domain-containing protein, partial [Chloroflexota bacterium]
MNHQADLLLLQEERRQRYVEAALLLLLCLVPLLLYLPFLGTPFERDEGVYATIAQGVLDGKVPYRDLFDNKPPLVYGWTFGDGGSSSDAAPSHTYAAGGVYTLGYSVTDDDGSACSGSTEV